MAFLWGKGLVFFSVKLLSKLMKKLGEKPVKIPSQKLRLKVDVKKFGQNILEVKSWAWKISKNTPVIQHKVSRASLLGKSVLDKKKLFLRLLTFL